LEPLAAFQIAEPRWRAAYDLAAGRALAQDWRERLLAQADLATQLLGFVAERR